MAKGWPACLCAVAAACLLVKDALKFTLGGNLTVYVPHAVLAILEQKGGHWLTQQRMAKYQAILIDSPGVKCMGSTKWNPATLLPDKSPLLHDCIETIDMTYTACADLQDQPLDNPEVEFWTDESSYMVKRKRFTGFAVVTQNAIIKARTLPPTYSAQAAELVALQQALALATGQRANIYTDSRYSRYTLTKIMQETSLKWPNALPLALLRVRTSPRGKWKLRPFEIMYGRPYPLSRPILADKARVGDGLTIDYISCLAASVSQLHRDLNEIRLEGLTAPLHPFVPGDWVYIKGYKKEPLVPVWKGPFQVLLTTQTSVKVGGVKTWIHHTRLKHADAPPLVEARDTAARDENLWSAELGSDLRMLFRKRPAQRDTPPPSPEIERDEADVALTLPENEHI
ncbi:uncharacterized protein LOC125442259 [Sphaerodactylus townsendi]|uniref:uncharacterized protein LOC125442259 n=1 Tax=Sphaerodactylus townsendi TaxID=933632 RepID=UPI0020267200|nr:uncharacterized protein LOC125442259 [Sphaerodactylus townsendi]